MRYEVGGPAYDHYIVPTVTPEAGGVRLSFPSLALSIWLSTPEAGDLQNVLTEALIALRQEEDRREDDRQAGG